MIFPIVQLPHPILRKNIPKVKKIDRKLLDFLDNFRATLEKQADPEGLGLSANQVGFEYRAFLARIENRGLTLFLNPEILEFSKDEVLMTEGCLSVRNLYSKLSRPQKLKIRYETIIFDKSGKNALTKEIVEDFDGPTARVIQHETDHLNGIVFIDHALRQKAGIYRLVKHPGEEDEFIEVKI